MKVMLCLDMILNDRFDEIGLASVFCDMSRLIDPHSGDSVYKVAPRKVNERWMELIPVSAQRYTQRPNNWSAADAI